MISQNNTSAYPSRIHSVPFRVLIMIAWRNIRSRKLRSGLTIVGIVISVGAMYFLMSFGIGLQDLVKKEVLGNQSAQSITVSTPSSKLLTLNSENIDRISALPHVSEVSSSFLFPGSLSYSNSKVESIVYGIDTQYAKLASLSLSKGKFFETNDVFVALVNTSALRAMGVMDESSVIGGEVQLSVPLTDVGSSEPTLAHAYKVVGVVNSGVGSEVFVPKFNFESLGVGRYSDMRLAADEVGSVGQLRKQIESLGFQTTSPMDTVDQVNQVFKYFNVILISLSLIGMVIAILGMLNTLTISLIERTKEVGLMIVLGARPVDMRRLFTIEALLLSFLGAVIGLVVACGSAFVVNLIAHQLATSRGVDDWFSLFSMPWWLTLGVLAFMLVIGLVVVYFPARRAQRIDPIDVLRRE